MGRGGQFEGRELFEARGREFEGRGGQFKGRGGRQFKGRGGGQFEGGGRRFQEVDGIGIGIKDKPFSYRRAPQHHTSDSELNPRRVGGDYGRAGIGEGGGEEKVESTDNFDVVRGFKFH